MGSDPLRETELDEMPDCASWMARASAKVSRPIPHHTSPRPCQDENVAPQGCGRVLRAGGCVRDGGFVDCATASCGDASCEGEEARGRALSHSMAGIVRTSLASFSLTCERDWRYLETRRGAGPLVFGLVGDAVSAMDVAHCRPAARWSRDRPCSVRPRFVNTRVRQGN